MSAEQITCVARVKGVPVTRCARLSENRGQILRGAKRVRVHQARSDPNWLPC